LKISEVKLPNYLDLLNGILAVIVSLFNPAVAFVLVFTKLPMIIMATIFYCK
jgi:hypothetical protein